MEIKTHEKIDRALCGEPVSLAEGKSVVRLDTLDNMAADASGLVHGGFVFGLADYAAMLAVNHPNVVLGGAETKFLMPVKAGESVEARAEITETKGRKRVVQVEAFRGEDKVFEGTFTCFVTDTHVLSGK
jgi:acyl-coenzyme A thioesterase PaaI-like protein